MNFGFIWALRPVQRATAIVFWSTAIVIWSTAIVIWSTAVVTWSNVIVTARRFAWYKGNYSKMHKSCCTGPHCSISSAKYQKGGSVLDVGCTCLTCEYVRCITWIYANISPFNINNTRSPRKHEKYRLLYLQVSCFFVTHCSCYFINIYISGLV